MGRGKYVCIQENKGNNDRASEKRHERSNWITVVKIREGGEEKRKEEKRRVK